MDIPAWSKGSNQDNYNNELSETLQAGLSDNGWTFPQQTTTAIESLATMMQSGTIWFDTETQQLILNTTDGLVSINTTPFP